MPHFYLPIISCVYAQIVVGSKYVFGLPVVILTVNIQSIRYMASIRKAWDSINLDRLESQKAYPLAL